jgi:hypothetical protein
MDQRVEALLHPIDPLLERSGKPGIDVVVVHDHFYGYRARGLRLVRAGAYQALLFAW